MVRAKRIPPRGWLLTGALCLTWASVRAQPPAAQDPNIDTPEKAARLAELRRTIEGVGHWDVLTSKHYLIAYSWDPVRAVTRVEGRKEAQEAAKRYELAREMFAADFPLDGKVQARMVVVRLFWDVREAQQFSASVHLGGGRYSLDKRKQQALRRLVIGGELGAGGARYERWLAYYSELLGPDLVPHDWFEHSLGWAYENQRLEQGRRTFVHLDHQARRRVDAPEGRKAEVEEVEKLRRYLEQRTIATDEPMPDASNCVRFAAFLLDGPRSLGKGFDPAWSQIPATYARTLRETRDAGRAHKAAFGSLDWQRLGEAWCRWLRKTAGK